MGQLQKILIKGMVCHRCVVVVKDELLSLGLPLNSINLGEVVISATAKSIDLNQVDMRLKQYGFALIEDKRTKILESVKFWVSKVYDGDFDFPQNFRFSKLIANKLLKDYDSISSVFSTLQGQTLEEYIITFRIAKAKVLLKQGHDTLATIAFKLGYSSTAHLSKQFKEIAGINPSQFKQAHGIYNMIS